MRTLIIALCLCVVACRSGSSFVTSQNNAGQGSNLPWDGGAAGRAADAGDASTSYHADAGSQDGSVEPPKGCGDGAADPQAMTEACDDGNHDDGDGCSRTCTVESGFLCPPKGGTCAAQCGDGLVVSQETCDDHNSDDNDGCSRTCTLEPGWACPSPGEACVAARCGDAALAGSEACDDGNSDNGDGCSTDCAVEEGWSCIGSVCTAAECGDGRVAGDEACDDGDNDDGDGCSKDCSAIELYYTCPATGGECTKYTRCGDGTVTPDEACDDFNLLDGDGCTKSCSIEQGWTCASGMSCFTTCGDGILASVEQCDDGGTSDGTSRCTAGASSKHGNTCASDVECASVATCSSAKECTAGKTSRVTICSSNSDCNSDGKTDGVCGAPVSRCVGGTKDGHVCSTDADCPNDDGVCVFGDGCSATCMLQPGFACTTPGMACAQAVCGNHQVEGAEQCDDGNDDLGDGCTPLCKFEPDCSNGACDSRCGDGLKASDEACDDGNARDNDGCSHDCQLEVGYTCQVVDSAPASTVEIPIVLRDFRAHDFQVKSGSCGTSAHCCDSTSQTGCTAGHIDFEGRPTGGTGMLLDALDVDGKPQRKSASEFPANITTDPKVTYDDGNGNYSLQSVESFQQWYRSDDTINLTVLDKLTLSLTACPGGGTCSNGVCMGGDLDGKPCGDYYVFDSQTFFPLTGKGYNSTSMLADAKYDETYSTCDTTIARGNFHFTSEVRYWFKYEGDEVLYFRGDDDVWVFINGKLAVDIGGVHGAQNGCISLKPGQADCATNLKSIADLGLEVGNIYEVAVFQAERNTCLSSYKLTLAGFFTSKTTCESLCGNGVVTSDEVCDLGSTCDGGSHAGEACIYAAGSDQSQCSMSGGSCTSKNQGTSGDLPYNGCSQDCKERGAYCGDGTKNGPEQCDDGAAHNDGKYGAGHCNPDCTLSPRCGDGKVDGFSGEQCDNGSKNANNTYGACTKSCRFGPRCGDGKVQADQGEACDDGTNKSPYDGCAPGCVNAPSCGDGVVQPAFGEQCDDGHNTGEYGGCKSNCTRAAYCGDGQVSEPDGEQCDDGNTNSFDGCSSTCQAENLLF